MPELGAVMIGLAAAGATVAVVAAVGKFSGHLGDRVVDGLYYVSYGCTGLSVALFIVRGLFGGSH